MSIENDSSRLVIPDDSDGARMPLREHARELRRLTSGAIIAIFALVPLTYLFWPFCVKFLKLMYPLDKISSSVAQLRAVQLAGAIDLGTYLAMPAFAIALLIFALPGLRATEKRVTSLCFTVGFTVYYTVPPLVIWVISTEILPTVKSVLATMGISIASDAQAVNRTFVILVLALALLIAIPLALFVANGFGARLNIRRVTTTITALAPVVILPIWVLIVIYIYVPIIIYLTTLFMLLINRAIFIIDEDRLDEVADNIRSNWIAPRLRRRQPTDAARARR
jgi:hypothetical protein